MHRTRLPDRIGLLLLLIAAAACGHAASSPDPTFAGAWRIAGGEPAGIDDGAPAEPEPTLLGTTVTFGERSIEAPHPLGCADAHYETQALPADMLFQGTLGDAAAARAQALSLSATAAPTLMVRCDTGLFDYHLTQGGGDAPRLLIMLDRVIYSLERTDTSPPAS